MGYMLVCIFKLLPGVVGNTLEFLAILVQELLVVLAVVAY